MLWIPLSHVITYVVCSFSRPDSCNPYNLKVGSAVKDKVLGQYGTIRWIGVLQGNKDAHAGVEMVRHPVLFKM